MAHETQEHQRIKELLLNDLSLKEVQECADCEQEYPRYALNFELDDNGLCPECYQAEITNGYEEYVYAVRDEHPELWDFRGAKYTKIIDDVHHCAICMEHVAHDAIECSNRHAIACRECDQANSNFCPQCGQDLRSSREEMEPEEWYEYRMSEEYRAELYS